MNNALPLMIDARADSPPTRPLVVFGASGHGKVVADAAAAAGFTVIGHIDDTASAGTSIGGRPRLGDRTILPALAERYAGLGLGLAIGIGDNHERPNIAGALAMLAPSAVFPAVVHPAATLAPSARLGQGVVILARAVINPDATLDDFALVNTGAIVEHDCHVGRAASLAPAATMGGASRLGAGAALMMGALLRHRVTVGEHTVVGMGSVVLSDLPSFVVAWGNPARTQRTRTADESYL